LITLAKGAPMLLATLLTTNGRLLSQLT